MSGTVNLGESKMKNRVCTALILSALIGWTCGAVTVDIDQIRDDPNLLAWADRAKELIEQWHPRLLNMIPTRDFEVPSDIALVFRKGDSGIAWTSDNRITVMSGWIGAHPDDIGLVFHELVHVVQCYKSRLPGWITEGIADYLRWAIYEGKPQSWFPVSNKTNGYRDSYRVAAGFFLWLETDRCPGIVNRINTAARKGDYNDAIFSRLTGASLESLWADYMADRKKEQAPQTGK